MLSYAPIVSIRKLLVLLAALSVLLAPSAAAAAEHAMSMAGHQATMMKAGHCHGPSKSNGQHKMSADHCCMSMSASIVAPTEAVQDLDLAQEVHQFPPARIYHGLLAEIATPPPRIA